jgi:hypothetical protein
MHTAPLISEIPLERYRCLVAELSSERDSWDDTFWLRFAAQTAVLCPESPPALAHRIRSVADALLKHTSWFQALASPARFVVAAMLIQHHIPVADFIAEHDHNRELMNGADLRHERFYEIVTVLILLMTPGHMSWNLAEVERIKAIYDQMKRFHWWLTGPDDVPACAALAQCAGTAEEVVGYVEEAYQQLHAYGIPVGERLQTAANLLPLAGRNMDQTLQRFRALADVLKEHVGVLTDDQVEPLALLTLLDHEPELVIARRQVVLNELDLFQSEGQGAVNILIASDLTFLELVRLDHLQAPFTQYPAAADMLRSLHTYHLASAVLVSQIDPSLVQFLGTNSVPQWPYSSPFLYL